MTGAPVKVLHILGSLDRGGVETWLLNVLANMPPDRRQWQFDFCTLGPQPGRYESLARLGGCRVLSVPVAEPGFVRRLWRLLRAGEYRIVHSHVHHFSGFVLALAAAAGVAGRVAHSHNTGDGRPDALARRLYRSVAAGLLNQVSSLRLACSADAARALYGPRATQDSRVRVLHYGVPPAPPEAGASRPALRRRLGVAGSGAVVGHVGRFDRQKNHAFLLDVAARVHARRPATRWLLVGEGPGRAAAEGRARQLGISNLVLFCGLREDVPELLSGAMDAFLLPSLHEGLPVALLEAQAAGLPSLVSSRVTREAAVVSGAVEFLALEAGPERWAERTLERLDAGRIPREVARRQMVAGGFTIERSLAQLLDVYRQALRLPIDGRDS